MISILETTAFRKHLPIAIATHTMFSIRVGLHLARTYNVYLALLKKFNPKKYKKIKPKDTTKAGLISAIPIGGQVVHMIDRKKLKEMEQELKKYLSAKKYKYLMSRYY